MNKVEVATDWPSYLRIIWRQRLEWNLRIRCR